MSEHGVLPGLWPIPGDGVLARQGDLVLLIHPAGGAFTDRLLDLLADAARAGEGGGRFAAQVSAEFDSDAAAADTAADEHGPAAVAFGPAAGGTAVAVYGSAWAEITTSHGVQRLTAGQPYGRLHGVLPSRATKIRAGVRAADGDGATDPYLRLADGVVRAVGLVYAPGDAAWAEMAEMGEQAVPYHPTALDVRRVKQADSGGFDWQQAGAQAASEEDAGQAEQADSGAGDLAGGSSGRDFIAVSFAGGEAVRDVPRRDALPFGAEPPDEKHLGIAESLPPVVVGIYCKNGHFDDPEARYCAVCGIGMGQLTKVPQEGKRPPLGVLVLDDGSVCQLDADYVIGREPTLDTSVAEGRARPLRLAGASGLVSRIHARVELDGWQVFICDLDSANGTQVLLPGEKNGTRLEPRVRTPLVAGAQIRLGSDYGLRYDSHRHR